MIGRRLSLAALPAAMLVSHFARAQSVAPPANATNVIDTLARLGGFNEFLRLAQRAGRVEALRGAGPFILFAPSDVALGRIPRDVIEAMAPSSEGPNQPDTDIVRLMSFVDGHIVDGRAAVAGLSPAATRFRARNGNTIEVALNPTGAVQVGLTEGPGFGAGGLNIDGRARVIERGEVPATNGVVWPISLPLLA